MGGGGGRSHKDHLITLLIFGLELQKGPTCIYCVLFWTLVCGLGRFWWFIFTIFGVNGSCVGGWVVVVMANYSLNDGLNLATRGLYFNKDIFHLKQVSSGLVQITLNICQLNIVAKVQKNYIKNKINFIRCL